MIERLNYFKTLLQALLGKYAKTHSKDIAKAQRWIDSAQAQFASAVEEAELSEQHWEKVASGLEAQAEKLSKEYEEIMAKKNQATSFKNKIKQFIEQ